jgi:hypothetical protein
MTYLIEVKEERSISDSTINMFCVYVNGTCRSCFIQKDEAIRIAEGFADFYTQEAVPKIIHSITINA